MTRALMAVAKSQIASLAVRLKLSDEELVSLGAAITAAHFQRAGLDRRATHAILDHALEAAADGSAR